MPIFAPVSVVHHLVRGCGLLLWRAHQQRSFIHDDAFISLRDVVHLVQSGEADGARRMMAAKLVVIE